MVHILSDAWDCRTVTPYKHYQYCIGRPGNDYHDSFKKNWGIRWRKRRNGLLKRGEFHMKASFLGKQNHKQDFSRKWDFFLVLIPLVVALLALGIGRINVSPLEVLQSIGAHLGLGDALSPQIEVVLWNIRLPRILLALFVGAGLSAAGCVFQSLFSNPLATPDT